MLDSELRRTCPSAQRLGPARLDGYRLAFTRYSKGRGGGVADILQAPGNEVWGALWRIPNGERDDLDRREGVNLQPPAYHRIPIDVITPGGEQLGCLAYQVVRPAAEHVPPSAAYLRAMLEGARATGLSATYVAQIAALADGP